MKAVTGREFCKILERNGWKLMRIKGSHHIYSKEGSKVKPSIPVHGNKALKIGLQKHLMHLAGIRLD